MSDGDDHQKTLSRSEVTSISVQLHIQQIDTAIKEAETLAGWRLYVTNADASHLSLPLAVTYYRDEWLLERGFHRFKRGSLPALPIYFHAPRSNHWLDVSFEHSFAGIYSDGVCGTAGTYRNPIIFGWSL